MHIMSEPIMLDPSSMAGCAAAPQSRSLMERCAQGYLR
jgi:hypothetical protein